MVDHHRIARPCKGAQQDAEPVLRACRHHDLLGYGRQAVVDIGLRHRPPQRQQADGVIAMAGQMRRQGFQRPGIGRMHRGTGR